MNILLLTIVIVESVVLLILAIRGEIQLQKQEAPKPQEKMPLPEQKLKRQPTHLTPYDRILDFCTYETMTVNDFEKINLIPVGTIEKWKTQRPDLKHLTKAGSIHESFTSLVGNGKRHRRSYYKREIYNIHPASHG